MRFNPNRTYVDGFATSIFDERKKKKQLFDLSRVHIFLCTQYGSTSILQLSIDDIYTRSYHDTYPGHLQLHRHIFVVQVSVPV